MKTNKSDLLGFISLKENQKMKKFYVWYYDIEEKKVTAMILLSNKTKKEIKKILLNSGVVFDGIDSVNTNQTSL